MKTPSKDVFGAPAIGLHSWAQEAIASVRDRGPDHVVQVLRGARLAVLRLDGHPLGVIHFVWEGGDDPIDGAAGGMNSQ